MSAADAVPSMQISELNLAHRFGLEAEVSERVSENAENSPLTVPSAERKLDGRQRYCRKCRKFKPGQLHDLLLP
eukprot:3329763-Rhodomonas_salina.2